MKGRHTHSDPDNPTKRDILVLGLATKTGLSVLTVDDLLRNGWMLVERKDEPRRWVDPTANLAVR